LERKPFELMKQSVKAGASKRSLKNRCSWYWIPGGTIRDMVQIYQLQGLRSPLKLVIENYSLWGVDIS
jgi:hypothetical protein